MHNDLTNNVKEQRRARGNTQQELADTLQMSRQTIYSIEPGKFLPSLPLTLWLGKLLKMPVEALFTEVL